MSHRNHLSRRDLYAYGFKEGETWGDDRRELEAALWEIDQLERQTEYEYERRTPSHPWTSGRSSAWHPSHSSGGPFQRTRSNSDLYPISESRMSSQSYARYNDDSTFFHDGYQRGYARRTYPSTHVVPSVFHGYPGSQSPTTSWGYQSPYYASPSNSDYQDFRDSIHSSNHQNHGFAPSMAHSRISSYGPSYHSQYYSQHSPAQRISTPEQLQMVTRRNSRNEFPSPEHAVDPRHGSATPNMRSPHNWSMVATEGTVRSESPSVTSPRGMYSENLRDMGYASRASGYAEAFDDRFYGSSEEEYISDGVPSDESAGYRCPSDSEPEESPENDEYFSEGSDDVYSDYSSD